MNIPEIEIKDDLTVELLPQIEWLYQHCEEFKQARNKLAQLRTLTSADVYVVTICLLLKSREKFLEECREWMSKAPGTILPDE